MKKIVNGIPVELTPAEQIAVQAEWAANDAEQAEYEASFGYKDRRRQEYPSTADQLDLLYEAMKGGEIQKATNWFDTVKSVRDQYPKPA